MDLIKPNDVEVRMMRIRRQNILLDRDVAALYDVQTREVNQAVKNNPDKFPTGYVFELSVEENDGLKKALPKQREADTSSPGRGRHSKYPPKAFTEKGLYMLATVLKSPAATQATIAIVETFAKVRELSATVTKLSGTNSVAKQEPLIKKSQRIISDLMGEDREITGMETTIELNLAVLKVKHTVKRGGKK